MKRLTEALIIGVASVAVFSACVPITYTKSVTVQKDAQGNVTGITEYESITEPHSEMKKIEAVASKDAIHAPEITATVAKTVFSLSAAASFLPAALLASLTGCS